MPAQAGIQRSSHRSSARGAVTAFPPARERHRAIRVFLAALGRPGVSARFPQASHFHEAAFELPVAAQPVIEKLAGSRILAGVCPGADYAGMEKVLLLCTTETKSAADLESFANALEGALA